MRSVSIGTQLDQVEGLLDTHDLTDWEHGFVESLVHSRSVNGGSTSRFTERQVEVLDGIYRKHFA